MPLFPPRWARAARRTALLLVGFLLVWAMAWQGCILPPHRQYRPRLPDPAAIAVPPGYRVEVLAAGLNAPASLEITPDGTIYIGESGYGGAHAATAGYEGATPGRIMRLNRDGSLTVVAGGFHPPLAGFFHDRAGNLYVSHRGVVSVLTAAGRRDILSGLPSVGDHPNNNLTRGPDGKIYLAQGTVTNAGIVGLDNWVLWGRRFPGGRDIPCRRVVLRGVNARTADPRSVIPFLRVRTGAFSPFGHATRPGQVVRGQLPCNGSIMRINPDGSDPELVAWGLRNPFDLRFGPDGELYVTDNGFDPRGSRPIAGADLFHRIRPGAWYGWPDYWNGLPVTQLPAAGRARPQPLLAAPPARPERALASFDSHAGAAGFDFAPPAFGYAGQAFVAQWGSGTPRDPGAGGFNVVRLDLRTRQPVVFAANKRPGPASLHGGPGGFERPVAVRFGPDGAMYLLDSGQLALTRKGPYHVPDSGVLWRIRRMGN